ncbi:MAG: 1,4-dihydroxy-2-naphthoate octaprenyltransferase [Ignavibacteria bacterium]|nr:1,4-dihydroxy-2-naphthoate octaprenyltransferase [Ignavibacteria bacterium]
MQNLPKLKLWFMATRPFSFTASIIPVLFALVLAIYLNESSINWWLFPVALFGAVSFHIGANLVSDYYDFKFGIDTKETYGGSRILVENLLPPASILRAGLISFAFGFSVGLILVYVRGYEVLLMGLAGLFCGLFYTFSRKGLKYIALGDVAIFIAFGPLLVIGSYFSLTGVYGWNILWYSLPIGFLVVAILHANNTRDLFNDMKANIKTIPIFLGLKGSQIYYYFLIFGAYLLVILQVITKSLGPYSLLVLLTLPVALQNTKSIATAKSNDINPIIALDVKTAQLHMQFGLLLIISIILNILL